MSDVDTILADFERLKTACRDLSHQRIMVGIVGGADSDVVRIAHAHEYGDGGLPERSFLRASFDADQDKLGRIVTGAVCKVLDGKSSASAAANSIGAQAAQLVQSYIDENRVKPQSDFSRKTQHTTLYETGTHIRDRISYKVEDA